MTLYQYPVSACDAVCKGDLECYRAKRDLWIEWLDTDRVHADYELAPQYDVE
jgi:hypothetical protein